MESYYHFFYDLLISLNIMFIFPYYRYLVTVQLILALIISSNIIPFLDIIYIFVSIPSILSSKKSGAILNG